MKTLILGGESEVNKKWLDLISKTSGNSAIKYEYSHWNTDANRINFETELERLKKYSTTELIIAKSAGTMVALYAIDKKILNPNKCIFMGIPLLWANEREEEKKGIKQDLIYLNNKYKDIITYVQQDEDPLCPAQKLIDILGSKDYKNKVNVIKGNDHWYGDVSLFSNHLNLN